MRTIESVLQNPVAYGRLQAPGRPVSRTLTGAACQVMDGDGSQGSDGL